MLLTMRLPRGLEVGNLMDFAEPLGEPALVAPDSLSWRVFKNPIALLVGGIAAVVLELADPAVRTGVWEHSTFLKDPGGRLRRTGLAAMVTVYGARSRALPLIHNVVRRHGHVRGTTPGGEAFAANDERLLNWVQATAGFGFGHAYSRYAASLSDADFDRLYAEGAPAARLYGALGAPRSSAEMNALFESMRKRLEPSNIILEFLEVMRATRLLPSALQRFQPMLVGAAVELLPDAIRTQLRLSTAQGLRPHERAAMRVAGGISDKIVFADAPPAQSCRRLGLPSAYLYIKPQRQSR